MKTYLKITFSSEGTIPSEIKNQLLNMGFQATRGNYDFVYEWDEETVSVEDLVWFADKIHATLKNHKVFFNIETL